MFIHGGNKMKIKKGKHYLLGGMLFEYKNDKCYDFYTDIMISEIEENGTIWAVDKEGNEFEVLEEDLEEIM